MSQWVRHSNVLVKLCFFNLNNSVLVSLNATGILGTPEGQKVVGYFQTLVENGICLKIKIYKIAYNV